MFIKIVNISIKRKHTINFMGDEHQDTALVFIQFDI